MSTEKEEEFPKLQVGDLIESKSDKGFGLIKAHNRHDMFIVNWYPTLEDLSTLSDDQVKYFLIRLDGRLHENDDYARFFLSGFQYRKE